MVLTYIDFSLLLFFLITTIRSFLFAFLFYLKIKSVGFSSKILINDKFFIIMIMAWNYVLFYKKKKYKHNTYVLI